MANARDIMTTDVVTVFPDTDITQAAKLLLDRRINGVPVIDADNKVVGILCQSDLIAQQKNLPLPSLFTFLDGFISFTSSKQFEKEVQKIAATKVSEAMTPHPVTVSPQASLAEVATLMVDKNFHTLPVVENKKLVGILGKEDVLKTLVDN
jgi:CBS domain-containing protein